MPIKKQSVTAAPALPEPPAIPASNASYAKVAGELHKAALLGNVAAVTFIRDRRVKGTNTYCRILRRYADKLVEALAPPPAPEPKHTKVVALKGKPVAVAQKAPKKVKAPAEATA